MYADFQVMLQLQDKRVRGFHILPPLSFRHWTYSSQLAVQILLWYLRNLMLRRTSSVICPVQPDLRIAWSTVSILSHPCSGAICGRKVAVYVRLWDALRVWTEVEDDNGEGASEDKVDAGWGKEM